ncbi:MAG: hypothetical protein KF819_24875 [Labilithrix sp.]|nr:hypothetical protein [Labilithrix sp.]
MVSCGGFGASDGEQGTPAENAQPPSAVDGKPIPGIYVSASKGDDGGSGSPVRPLKTLRAAFALAKQQGLRVLACAETYEENVEVVDGVSAYGYFDCNADPWKQVTERRAKVKAPVSPALVAQGIKLPTRLEGFEIIAPNLDAAPAAAPELGTSVAASIGKSTGLAFGQMTFRAGNGAPGGPGSPPAANNVESGSPRGSASVAQVQMECLLVSCGRYNGAAGGTSQCATGPNGGPGGMGGDGMWATQFPCTEPTGFVVAGRPLVATATTAVGGAFGGGGTGSPGANGPNGDRGLWTLDPETGAFIPGDGATGAIGAPGQGGGGGRGSNCWSSNSTCATCFSYAPFKTATGGGGGAGGCGGTPGTGGKGGGASIGVLMMSSDIIFTDTLVYSARGGAAGKGGEGLEGLVGGLGGADTRAHPPPAGLPDRGSGAPGGNGGKGGTGGFGGHGAAGPSIAFLVHGKRPDSPTQTLHLLAGSGGEGQPAITRSTPTGPATLPEAPAGQSIPLREF